MPKSRVQEKNERNRSTKNLPTTRFFFRFLEDLKLHCTTSSITGLQEILFQNILFVTK